MDIHKCFTCSIEIYNMTTIRAILISVKDHLFHPYVRLNLNLVGGLRATWKSELLESFDSDIQFGSHGNNLDFFQKA